MDGCLNPQLWNHRYGGLTVKLYRAYRDFFTWIGDVQCPQSLHCSCMCAPCMPSHFSAVQLFATPWTVVLQAPLSMEFSRQEYWSGLLSLLQGIFPTQGSNPCLWHFPLAGGFFTTSATWEAQIHCSWGNCNCLSLFRAKNLKSPAESEAPCHSAG